jgi:hypothetical protein
MVMACRGRRRLSAVGQLWWSTQWWELRVATSLAQLWVASGDHRRAHRLLAPLCRFFIEGLDMPDLKGARTLLDTSHPPLTVA